VFATGDPWVIIEDPVSEQWAICIFPPMAISPTH
jgi:hypothetical protein